MDRYSLNISYSVGKGIQISIYIYNIHSSQRGTKSHLKKQSHLKSPFPPEMALLKSQQNFPSRLKPNFLFTPMLSICFKKFSR